MSDQSKITTQGPADTQATTRVKVYAGISAALGVVGLLATFNVVTADQALSIKDFAEAGMNLAGSFGLGFAAVKTRKQVGNGTFMEAPANPVGNAFDALAEIKQRADDTLTDALSQAAHAATAIQGAAAMIPGGGLITGAVMSGPVGDLVQWARDQSGDDGS